MNGVQYTKLEAIRQVSRWYGTLAKAGVDVRDGVTGDVYDFDGGSAFVGGGMVEIQAGDGDFSFEYAPEP